MDPVIRRFGENDSTRLWEHFNRLATDVEALIESISGNMQQYNVSWTTLGSNDTTVPMDIKDGTMIGWYAHRGAEVSWQMLLVRGTDTNQGAGVFQWSLPPVGTIDYRQVSGYGYLRRGTEHIPVTAIGVGNNMFGLMNHAGRLSSTNPGNLAAGHVIFVRGTYRTAQGGWSI